MLEQTRQFLVEGERAGMRYALGLPRQTPMGATGISLSPRVGSSLEFKEFRGYEPGDDLRHIDWNAYARSDQLHVKLFREEVNPHLDLVLDTSRSMALEESAKSRATLGLAGFFAAAASNAGFTHGAWRMSEGLLPVGNSNARPGLWEEIPFTFRGNPAESLGRQPPHWRSRGIRILFSDLLWVGDPLSFLGHFGARASSVVVVQILAEADVNPPTAGNLRLVDSETEQLQEIYLDAQAVRRYRETLTRHQQNWHRACRQVGAHMTVVVAETLLRDWQLEELMAAEVLKVAGR